MPIYDRNGSGRQDIDQDLCKLCACTTKNCLFARHVNSYALKVYIQCSILGILLQSGHHDTYLIGL